MPKKTNFYFRMPAEWERQQSTLIGWPCNKNDWPDKFKNIPGVFSKIVSKITKSQEVKLLIKNYKSKNTITKLLRNSNANIRNVKFIICKTDRVWMRDTGPIFIKDKNNQNILLNWKFNGWAKYKNYREDNKVNLRIKKHYKGNVISPKFNKKSIVLEGGAIDVNGKGLLLTTKECLLSKIQQRNSFLKLKNYNHIFNRFFGVKKVIWLNKGIAGDDTHGHVDDIARFVKSNKVFLAYENNKKDKNFKNLDENFEILKKTKINSSQIKIIKIPMPKPIYIKKVRVPASYLNFYIFNKFVLLPIFNDPKDKVVIKIFRKEFNNRKIIPIDCSKLIWGFGAIHCLTQQEPK